MTRPRAQSQGLCALIEASGGHALSFPLLAIEPSDDAVTAQAVLRSLDRCDWLIFISANAVRFATQLAAGWQNLSSRTRVAAIGRGTAEALRACGVGVDLQPKAQFNSESLLEAAELASVAGRQIVIVRGRGGRETLAETLRERGATVSYAEVYRRVPAGEDISWLLAKWRDRRVDAVILTSGDALHQLVQLLCEANADLLVETPLVVIGERIALLARELGCRRVAVAAEASDAGLCDAVIRLARAERLEFHAGQ